MYVSFALLFVTNVKFRRMRKKGKEDVTLDAVMDAHHLAEKEIEFNLHHVTNVSDIVSILIMKDSDEPNV